VNGLTFNSCPDCAKAEAFLLVLLWSGLGFFFGAIPFSYLLGRLIAHADIRLYGDGNPGGINAWRAGGWRAGIPALFLDFLKGAVPVGIARMLLGLSGWGLVPVGLAPVVGHAFSPFLRLRGGKAVAATFGAWAGLTLAEGPTALGVSMGAFYLVQSSDAWSVVLGMLAFSGYLLLRGAHPGMLAIWGGHFLVLGWKHRRELRQTPRPRPFWGRLSGGGR
jgi:glycerol-3-phosphate acyltransferase PlsY